MREYDALDVKIARILDELHDEVAVYDARIRLPIELIADRLKARGLIAVDARAMELELTRKLIQRSRGLRKRNREVQKELVNLREQSLEGETQQYYKRVGDLDLAEAAYILNYWHKQRVRCSRRIREYADVLQAKYGDELQRQLRFDIMEWV